MGIFREVRTAVYCDVCGGYVIGWKSTRNGTSKSNAKYFARQEGCTTGEKIVCKKMSHKETHRKVQDEKEDCDSE